MTKEKVAILPKLYDAKGDMTKQWFVFFSYRNPQSGKMERFKDYEGFQDLRTRKERIQHGGKLIAFYKRKLRSGWNPFEDKQILFSDQIIHYKPQGTREQIESLLLSALQSTCRADRDKSIGNYKLYIRYFLEYLVEKDMVRYQVGAITEDIAEDFLQSLITDRKLSNKTHNEVLSLMKRLFNHLIRKKKISFNPFFYIKNRKHYRAPRPFFPDHLRELLIDDIKEHDPVLFLFINLTYYLMRRKTELTQLRVRDLILEQGVIQLPGKITKTGTLQVVDIPKQLLQMIIEHKFHQYPQDYYLIGREGVPSNHPVGKNFFYKRWIKFRDKYGLNRKYGVYSWKHTASVSMKLAGFDIKDIMDHGGWASLQMVDNYMKGFSIKGSDKIQNHFPDITFSTQQSLRPEAGPVTLSKASAHL